MRKVPVHPCGRLLVALSTVLVLIAFSVSAETSDEPAIIAQESGTSLFSADGYRLDRYRSPTPASAPGAQTIDTERLQSMLKQESALLLIDVINATYLQERFVEDEPHLTIPTAYWLPNTGQGNLEAIWQNYLLDNLARLTENDTARSVVIFCKSDCWLSWNVARRMTAAGYSRVYWYRDGIDSWTQAGLPTTRVEPVEPAHT
jgi:PQQ-dependent catabolism-associated CXXCW motif protein